MGLGQRILTQFRSAILFFGLGLENFTKKSQIFQFFLIGSKKLSLGWVKKLPWSRRVGLLFNAGQKNVRVESGPISSPIYY